VYTHSWMVWTTPKMATVTENEIFKLSKTTVFEARICSNFSYKSMLNLVAFNYLSASEIWDLYCIILHASGVCYTVSVVPVPFALCSNIRCRAGYQDTLYTSNRHIKQRSSCSWCMVVGFEYNYHLLSCEFESHSWQGVLNTIQHYVIKFFSDLRHFGGFLHQ
jgi:hypothetical protein